MACGAWRHLVARGWVATGGSLATQAPGCAFLHSAAPLSLPAAIVRSIAEKVDTMIPGSFDAGAFPE